MKLTKAFKLALALTLAVLFLGISPGTVFANSEGDYRSGYKHGQKVAKEDALNFKGYRSGITGQIERQKHIENLRQTQSDGYIKGFRWGYEASFDEHIKVYSPHCVKG